MAAGPEGAGDDSEAGVSSRFMDDLSPRMACSATEEAPMNSEASRSKSAVRVVRDPSGHAACDRARHSQGSLHY